MIAAKKLSGKFNTEMFDDVPVLQRKWRAALKPGQSLPRYEDVMLGSLGRLADHVILLRGEPDNLELSRSGRYAQRWLGTEAWDVSLDALPPDCATAVAEAVAAGQRARQAQRQARAQQQAFHCAGPAFHDENSASALRQAMRSASAGGSSASQARDQFACSTT